MPQTSSSQSRVRSLRYVALDTWIKNWLTHDRLILTYLIPCHLLTTHTLPNQALLSPYPRLEALFRPLCQCIKSGNLAGFDEAMLNGEQEFVKRRIYLTLERGRDIALRNLCRKVFVAGGFEENKGGETPIRRTRVPVSEFAAAMRLGSNSSLDMDEVECFLANLIYKVSPIQISMVLHASGISLVATIFFTPHFSETADPDQLTHACFQNLMKGYISRERGTVVLSKGGAFPGTGV